MPELRDHLIAVNPFGGESAARSNRRPLRESLAWLRAGGLLAAFPAGDVSSLRWPYGQVADPAWSETVVRLARLTGATVVPAFFAGGNGPLFHLAGLVHPGLRTLLLGRELLNKGGSRISLAMGVAVPPQRLAAFASEAEATDYLRDRTYLLQARHASPQPALRRDLAPLASVTPAAALRAEVDALPAEQCLLAQGDHRVLLASAPHMPRLLSEIGRLRELTFRKAGEGTGRPRDLDRFDESYQHLFVWNDARDEVVGAYRLTGTDTVPTPHGLYTATLFHLRPGFLDGSSPALELGRSFVRPECQRGYAPLLLLWKGIGQYLVRHPRYRRLFGPVSVSNKYGPAARQMIQSFLEAHCHEESLARGAEGRSRLRSSPLQGCDLRRLGRLLADVDELSSVVADLERDGKGVPVLLRQYLSLGGRVASFHVDRAFGNTLDGLIVVDLPQAPRHLLERYLGKAGAAEYLGHPG